MVHNFSDRHRMDIAMCRLAAALGLSEALELGADSSPPQTAPSSAPSPNFRSLACHRSYCLTLAALRFFASEVSLVSKTV